MWPLSSRGLSGRGTKKILLFFCGFPYLVTYKAIRGEASSIQTKQVFLVDSPWHDAMLIYFANSEMIWVDLPNYEYKCTSYKVI